MIVTSRGEPGTATYAAATETYVEIAKAAEESASSDVAIAICGATVTCVGTVTCEEIETDGETATWNDLKGGEG